MILGITGSRKGFAEPQLRAISTVVSALPERIVHGGAIGVDECMDDWFRRGGLANDRIEVYPASADRQRAMMARGCVIHEVMSPLHRNKTIAARCDHLLACPSTMDEVLRSGTWATIRYARAAGKPITIVLPDGTVKEER